MEELELPNGASAAPLKVKWMFVASPHEGAGMITSSIKGYCPHVLSFF